MKIQKKNIYLGIITSICSIFLFHSECNAFDRQNTLNQELNENNYMSIKPDFDFPDMNILFSVSNQYKSLCSDELTDFYCIYSAYNQIANKNKTKEKYLGKIIKVPFTVRSYSNGNNDDVYISDQGIMSEYQSQSESSFCHLTNSPNIEKYISETNNKIGVYNVIGVLSDINSSDGMLILDPCFYISKK